MRLLLVVTGGMAVGALTNLGGAYLPAQLGAVDDSTGVWTLAAATLSLLGRRRLTAALYGVAAFVALLGGYELVARLQGFETRSEQWVFWGAAALVVGPVVGVLTWWGRHDAGTPRSLAVAVVAGILVGEGVWGLTDESAGLPGFWWLSIALGAAGVAVVGCTRRPPRQAVLAIALTAAVATAFVVVYRLPLYSLVL